MSRDTASYALYDTPYPLLVWEQLAARQQVVDSRCQQIVVITGPQVITERHLLETRRMVWSYLHHGNWQIVTDDSHGVAAEVARIGGRRVVVVGKGARPRNSVSTRAVMYRRGDIREWERRGRVVVVG